MNFNQLLQTPNAPQPMQAWAVNKGSHQRSAAVGRDLFILRYTLFPKKGILAACNRNVNQTVNLPARPWPALPMLTQVSRDKNNKKKKRSKIQTVQQLFTGRLAGLTFYTVIQARGNEVQLCSEPTRHPRPLMKIK